MAISYGGDSIQFADGTNIASGRTGFINRVINGDMRIDQRNAGASVTPTAGSPFTVDRWLFSVDQSSKMSFQQNAGSVTPPVGFGNYLGFTTVSAYSVGASETWRLEQNIEGFNTADLNWGTVNAKTVTLSFKVYSSLTGTFGGAISNSARNRSYPFSYSIPVANTWTPISITIAGDTTGTWIGATNGIGMRIEISLGTGSTLSGTAGAWAGATYISATGATSVVGTNGATFYITGVDLRAGTYTTAPTWEFRSIGQELALCQRYYEKSFDFPTAPTSANAAGGAYGLYSTSGSAGGLTTAYLDGYVGYRVEKRAAPTVTCFDAAGNSGVCSRISPGVASTQNQNWLYASQASSGFICGSISGASAGRIAFYWMSSAEL